MKYIKFILIAALVAFYTIEDTQASPAPSINCEIVWGRPSKNCTGFGICKIKISVEWDFKSGGTRGTISIDEQEKICTITVKEDDLKLENVNKIDYFKNKNTAAFEEDFNIPIEVLKAAGCKGSVKINKGTYKITHVNDNYSISFPF